MTHITYAFGAYSFDTPYTQGRKRDCPKYELTEGVASVILEFHGDSIDDPYIEVSAVSFDTAVNVWQCVRSRYLNNASMSSIISNTFREKDYDDRDTHPAQ